MEGRETKRNRFQRRGSANESSNTSRHTELVENETSRIVSWNNSPKMRQNKKNLISSTTERRTLSKFLFSCGCKISFYAMNEKKRGRKFSVIKISKLPTGELL